MKQTKTHRRQIIIQIKEDKNKIKKARERRYSNSEKAIQDILMQEVYSILNSEIKA